MQVDPGLMYVFIPYIASARNQGDLGEAHNTFIFMTHFEGTKKHSKFT